MDKGVVRQARWLMGDVIEAVLLKGTVSAAEGMVTQAVHKSLNLAKKTRTAGHGVKAVEKSSLNWENIDARIRDLGTRLDQWEESHRQFMATLEGISSSGASVEKSIGKAATPATPKVMAESSGARGETLVGESIAKAETELNLTYKEGMNPRDFDRKTRALQDLAERGKLAKAETPLDRNFKVTRDYRRDLVARAEKHWGATEPERVKNLERKIKSLDADHLKDLQLSGLDDASNLWLLDKKVNQSLGSQIQHQIKDLKPGDKITKVNTKGLPE